MIHPLTTFAVNCNNNFILPTWHKYLPKNDECRVNLNRFSFPEDIGLIALGVVEILLRVGLLVAVGYVIYGGFMYMMTQGEPDKAANARRMIVNAVIGLVIGLLATGIVAFIGGRLI